MANRFQPMDQALQKCYEHDLDWTLLPEKLLRVCTLFGKGMKQKATTILLGLLSLISFSLGHGAIDVSPFWSEPVIFWLVVVLPTGRCKSAFHQFLYDLMQEVIEKIHVSGNETKPVFLPHCTWDKFGDIMANSGGRSIGLFDKLVSFFTTMNMYSSAKLQLSDSKEYQDFLQMYTGKTKTRETVTGNANFNMAQTSFTLLGFTQPQTAMPIIEDTQNNAKGFTSRFLWFFPEPVFCRMQDTLLNDGETSEVEAFKNELVNFLAELYIEGESTFEITQEEKITTVVVNRKKYKLTLHALQAFENVHDHWEMNICKKYPYEPLIGGLFSRGKSQILRLATPIQLLLHFMETFKEATGDNDKQNENERDMQEAADECVEENTLAPPADKEIEEAKETEQNHDRITAETINIAASIVTCSLTQLSILGGKQHVMNGVEVIEEKNSTTPTVPLPTSKLVKQVLLTPGEVVSMSIHLNQKSTFRKHSGLSGKPLMAKVLEDITEQELGEVETFNISTNKTKRQPPPSESEHILEFIEKLAKVGLHLKEYTDAYNSKNSESDKHQKDYEIKRNNTSCSYSPSKRPKLV